MQKNKIITLNENNNKEMLNVITTSFTNYPHIPSLEKKPEHTKFFMEKIIDIYNHEKTYSFGIKSEGKLISLCFCTNASFHPKFKIEISFGFSIIKKLGIKGLLELWKITRNKPNYQEPLLELVLLATLPIYHGNGLGKQILDFLYGFAKENNFKGIVAVTNSKRHAFKFYLKEGWIVDKKFKVGQDELCWIRKNLA